MFEWDINKAETNLLKHRVSIDAIYGFDWDDAMIWEDRRKDYGESRMAALGFIGERLFFCAFVDRDAVRRIITLRKANSREIRIYNGD